MNVVILAGGRGTRLSGVVRGLPKPMADIGGKPFLELLMGNLARFGVEQFILCVSHLREAIKGHFGKSFLGLPIFYSVEEEPLGTGGAIKKAFVNFKLSDALVMNGDTYLGMDYGRFMAEAGGENLVLALAWVKEANRYGLVEVMDGRVTSFYEKSETSKAGLINAGVYRVKANLLETVDKERFSFEKDFLEPWVAELRPAAFVTADYFIDIGVPESYARAREDFRKGVFGVMPCI